MNVQRKGWKKIKSELTDNFTCLPKIIKIIINYIEENIFNDKRNTNEILKIYIEIK